MKKFVWQFFVQKIRKRPYMTLLTANYRYKKQPYIT